MIDFERINGSQVRHRWKDIAAGVAAGKSFLVENYGKPEALIVSPNQLHLAQPPEFDVEGHFARIRSKPPVPDAVFDAPRAAEL